MFAIIFAFYVAHKVILLENLGSHPRHSCHGYDKYLFNFKNESKQSIKLIWNSMKQTVQQGSLQVSLEGTGI